MEFDEAARMIMIMRTRCKQGGRRVIAFAPGREVAPRLSAIWSLAA
jgi:hypothetical protein